ncbi:hypothetical protein GCM10010440_19000 [Kitasatospora cinereorecta]
MHLALNALNSPAAGWVTTIFWSRYTLPPPTGTSVAAPSTTAPAAPLPALPELPAPAELAELFEDEDDPDDEQPVTATAEPPASTAAAQQSTVRREVAGLSDKAGSCGSANAVRGV